jgi:sirohydrochlorin cobaltochelatase
MHGSVTADLPGVIVIGHGTADATGAEETRRTAAMVADLLPGAAVELGFLELAAPSIDDAVARLAARGCRAVVAVPVLLFRAGHARRDVPEALAAAAARHGLAVRQAEPLGCHPAIVALARRRREAAAEGRDAVAAPATRLVVLGRGSSDPRAVCQLCRLTLAASAGVPAAMPLHLGFAAAARPTLDEALAEACAAAGVRRIIVQPHLLFAGHVEGQVDAAVARGRARRPDIEWLRAARLGADPAVAAALVERAMEVAPELRNAVSLAANETSPRAP